MPKNVNNVESCENSEEQSLNNLSPPPHDLDESHDFSEAHSDSLH